MVGPAQRSGQRVYDEFRLQNPRLFADIGDGIHRAFVRPFPYLRHRCGRLVLTECPETLDKQDATFVVLKGLAQDRDGWISLGPLMFPGHYLQVRDGELWTGPRQQGADFPKSATFRFNKPVSPSLR
ncbi:MAG: AbfB domain-containing protein [Isosphaeraceae bacterium]